MFTLVQERPQDGLVIENLYAAAFGPGRKARTAERLRENNAPVADLCFIAEEDGALAGSVRFWPILASGNGKNTPGLLLGPLAVQPHRQRNGMGLAMIEAGLSLAAQHHVPFVVLVGDEPYYSRAGFSVAAAGRFAMPGPVDAGRLLVRELNGAGQKAAGSISANPDGGSLATLTSSAISETSATFTPPAAQQSCA